MIKLAIIVVIIYMLIIGGIFCDACRQNKCCWSFLAMVFASCIWAMIIGGLFALIFII